MFWIAGGYVYMNILTYIILYNIYIYIYIYIYSISLPKTVWFSGDRVYCQLVRLASGGQWTSPETVRVGIYSPATWMFLVFFFQLLVRSHGQNCFKSMRKNGREIWILSLKQKPGGRPMTQMPPSPDLERSKAALCSIWGRGPRVIKKDPEIEDESFVVIPKSQGRAALQEEGQCQHVPTLH